MSAFTSMPVWRGMGRNCTRIMQRRRCSALRRSVSTVTPTCISRATFVLGDHLPFAYTEEG